MCIWFWQKSLSVKKKKVYKKVCKNWKLRFANSLWSEHMSEDRLRNSYILINSKSRPSPCCCLLQHAPVQLGQIDGWIFCTADGEPDLVFCSFTLRQKGPRGDHKSVSEPCWRSWELVWHFAMPLLRWRGRTCTRALEIYSSCWNSALQRSDSTSIAYSSGKGHAAVADGSWLTLMWTSLKHSCQGTGSKGQRY